MEDNKAKKKVKYPEIGKRIREARLRKGKTQKECQIPLGDVTSSMISEWESGYAFPSVTYLKKISEYFDVSIDYLVFGEKEQNKNDFFISEKMIVNLLLILYNNCGFTWHIENRDGSYSDINSDETSYKLRFSTKDLFNFK